MCTAMPSLCGTETDLSHSITLSHAPSPGRWQRIRRAVSALPASLLLRVQACSSCGHLPTVPARVQHLLSYSLLWPRARTGAAATAAGLHDLRNTENSQCFRQGRTLRQVTDLDSSYRGRPSSLPHLRSASPAFTFKTRNGERGGVEWRTGEALVLQV